MVTIEVVLHDVSSANKLIDFAKATQNYSDYIKLVIFSRISGGASQYGLADASKILFKEDIPFLYVNDLQEINELGLFKERRLIQFSRAYGKPFKTLKDIAETLDHDRIVLIFSGSDTGFSKSEIIPEANVVYPEKIKRDVTPEAYLTLIMHFIINNIF